MEEIHEDHTREIESLRTAGEYIMRRLGTVPCIHSLKLRIKNPEHLVRKIVRKRREDSSIEVATKSYPDWITDLIGIRALHLLKGDWLAIHKFIMQTWNLRESPIAYVRGGDPDFLIAAFKENGCKVQVHPKGYRSLHYTIKFQPEKRSYYAELQVRTIFEEGWSEIDRLVRYPQVSDNPVLTQLLTIFNTLSGSADEMGTFTTALSGLLAEHAAKESGWEREAAGKEQDLQRAIAALQISEQEKVSLQVRISEASKAQTNWPSFSGDLQKATNSTNWFLYRALSRFV